MWDGCLLSCLLISGLYTTIVMIDHFVAFVSLQEVSLPTFALCPDIPSALYKGISIWTLSQSGAAEIAERICPTITNVPPSFQACRLSARPGERCREEV